MLMMTASLYTRTKNFPLSHSSLSPNSYFIFFVFSRVLHLFSFVRSCRFPFVSQLDFFLADVDIFDDLKKATRTQRIVDKSNRSEITKAAYS